MIIAWIAGQFASLGLPQRLREPLAWVALVLAVLALLWAGKALYDASVIEDHEQDRAADAIPAYSNAAEQRAADVIRDIMLDQDRVDAVKSAAASEAAKPPSERATLPPTTLALNCKRMEQAYSARELAKMAAYQEKCR